MKNFLTTLLIGLLLSGACVTAQAQLRTGDEMNDAGGEAQGMANYLGMEKLRALLPAAIELNAQNVSVLVQNGTGNNATILQQTSGGNLANEAFIVQVGNNTLNLNQIGSGNTMDFNQSGRNNASTIVQDGYSNKIEGSVVGNNNSVNATQKGNDNQILSRIEQENGKIFNMTQTGNSNTLLQVETTSQTKGYSVDMRGNGINLIIEQGKVGVVR